MSRFVVLLRGVNVGKGNRVPMAEFKVLLEGLGYTNVSTILNSGNAVFTSSGRSPAKHAAAIAATLQQKLGVSTPVIVKSVAELSTIIGASPITPPDAGHSRYFVAFAAEKEALLALAPLQSLTQPPERFVVSSVAAFLHCPAGILGSKVGKPSLNSTFGRQNESRRTGLHKVLAGQTRYSDWTILTHRLEQT